VLRGVAFGLQFNPLASAVGSAGAAALVGYPSAQRSRWAWALLLLTGAWLIGDAMHVWFGLGQGPTTDAIVVVSSFVVLSFGVGYLLPALAGAYVGRRVTHGTGWLSAIAVAGLVAAALSWIAPTLSELLVRPVTG
jgi:hypothetical protein